MSERRAGVEELVWAGAPAVSSQEVMVAWTPRGGWRNHDGQKRDGAWHPPS